MTNCNSLEHLVGLRGLQIVENSSLTRTVTWRTERPWCHRKRHQPGRAFNYRSKQVPDNAVYRTVDKLVMHPQMAQRLRTALETVQ